jgi:hypothetical protein
MEWDDRSCVEEALVGGEVVLVWFTRVNGCFEPVVITRDMMDICQVHPRSQTRDLGHPSVFLLNACYSLLAWQVGHQ